MTEPPDSHGCGDLAASDLTENSFDGRSTSAWLGAGRQSLEAYASDEARL